MSDQDEGKAEGGVDREAIIREAKRHGVNFDRSTDEIVAKFAYCVSERILAGEPMKKAIARCLVEIRDLI